MAESHAVPRSYTLFISGSLQRTLIGIYAANGLLLSKTNLNTFYTFYTIYVLYVAMILFDLNYLGICAF